MKGFIGFIFIIFFIALLINFPLLTIGLVLIGWRIYEFTINKKLKVKSKTIPVILAFGVLLTFAGCESEDNKNDIEQETAKKEELAASIKEEQKEQKEEKKQEQEIKKEEAAKPEEKKEPKQAKSTSSKNEEMQEAVKETGEKATDTAGTAKQIPVTLVKTIDGDTIKVLYNGKEQNVRYLLVDTPETNHPRLGKQPFGEEAKERNRQLVNSGQLTLEFDIGERVDKYGRLLAYVYADGQSVQKTLLEEGLARVAYVYPPNTRHLTPFEEAQNRAKQKGIGIWSIENYATDSGFKGSVSPSEPSGGSSSQSTGMSGGNGTEQESPPASKPAPSPPASQPSGTEYFQNCTELTKVYPHGVPKGHPAYQPKMDRDKDGYACER